MPKIFISYRRADTKSACGRIYDRLVDAFSKENIFKDVEVIPLGVDFRKYIQGEISVADVVLVVIGPDWSRIIDEHRNDPKDFVRIEIESALQQGKLTIPVLVEGAKMPFDADLPESIQSLAFLNAAVIDDDPNFHRDVTRMIRELERPIFHLGTKPPVAPAILPPSFEWINIPGGELMLKDKYYVGTFTVEPFVIAKYPITNAQFQVFVDAPDGYHETRWWDYSSEARKWRDENPAPMYTTYADGDLPRTNVTWYEAVAFCRWLSEHTGQSITLPTEQQWQRAAQWDDRRIYPWGNKWDASRCNTKESGIGKPTPVTRYANGASPYGVMDMSGNVWEWCLNEYGKPRNVQFSGTEARVLRGGSFDEYGHCTACAYRYHNLSNYRNYYSGFRVYAAPK